MKNSLIKKQKGSVLLIAVILLFFILAIAIGLNALILVNLQTLKEAGNSIIAFYAADAGIEQVLREIYLKIPSSYEDISSSYSGSLSIEGASYEVTISCCDSGFLGCNCPKSFNEKEGCKGNLFCIDSIGTYKGSTRAIEVEI